MTPEKIVGRKYRRIKENYSFDFTVGDIATLIECEEAEYALFQIANGGKLLLDLGFMELIPEDSDRIATLEARVAELEAQIANQPKPEWWRQYKVGDKIDLIGLEIADIDEDDSDCRLEVRGETKEDAAIYLWFTDRHIRPHKPE